MSDSGSEHTMSDAEGLMWRLEKDAYMSSTFGTVTILDRAPDFDAFRRRMERASIAIPRLRQRVINPPAGVGNPTWSDDPDFSIDRHVRRIACPKPGTVQQVLDMAALMVSDPLDRTRPLWQFTVVEGLRGGKAALISKMHHTIADGERGIELSLQYFDFERDAPEPPPLTYQPRESSGTSDPLAATRDLVETGLRLPLGVAGQVRDLLADPSKLPDASGAAMRTFTSIARQLGDTQPARSPLWTERSLRRELRGVRASFHDTKAAAKKLGGTLNTAFVTCATDAAATYHQRLGAPVESLRTSIAVSTRTEESGNNAFSIVRMIVPTGEMPIDERFLAIDETIKAARTGQGSGGLEAISTLITALPTSLIIRLARQQAQTVDFATSNVKGAPVPVYAAGAQLLEIYPIGPLLGVAFNLTLMSYLGSLDMGVHIDPAAVAEPELLAECLDGAFERFAAI